MEKPEWLELVRKISVTFLGLYDLFESRKAIVIDVQMVKTISHMLRCELPDDLFVRVLVRIYGNDVLKLENREAYIKKLNKKSLTLEIALLEVPASSNIICMTMPSDNTKEVVSISNEGDGKADQLRPQPVSRLRPKGKSAKNAFNRLHCLELIEKRIITFADSVAALPELLASRDSSPLSALTCEDVDVNNFADHLSSYPELKQALPYKRTFSARPASTVAIPADLLHPCLLTYLQARGIKSLYSHQGVFFNHEIALTN